MKRSDLFLLASAALLAIPVYRGPLRARAGTEPMPWPPPGSRLDLRAPRVERLPYEPEPEPGDGEDRFDGPDLEAYTEFSDGGESWRLAGGSLLATGPAIQSVLVRNRLQIADGWVETESARADDGGLVLRFRAEDEYYLLAFRDDAAPAPRGTYNLAMYHKYGGEYRELWRADVRWPRGTSHAVRFEADGPFLRAWFDGRLVGQVTSSPEVNDPRPYRGWGRVGLRHYGSDATWVTKFTTFRWHDANPPLREMGRPQGGVVTL